MPAKPSTITLDDERTYPETPDQHTFQHHLARYQFAATQMRGGERLLDTGCGTGYGVDLLSQRSAFALGVDYSPQALEYARSRYAGPRLQFALMNCHQLALRDASFDLVVSFEMFEHLESPDQYLAECRRVLRPGGRFLLSTPNRATADIHMASISLTNAFHIGMMDIDMFRQRLSRFFPHYEVYGQRRRGSRLYSWLRALDVWNLRLRLFRPERREQMQHALGVPVGEDVRADSWAFGPSQLRQSNNFIAICRKES